MSSLFLSSPKLVDRANQCVHVGRPSGTALKPSAQVHAANKLDGESDNASLRVGDLAFVRAHRRTRRPSPDDARFEN